MARIYKNGHDITEEVNEAMNFVYKIIAIVVIISIGFVYG